MTQFLILKVPPVAQVILFAFLMYAVDLIFPMSVDPTHLHFAAALIIVVLGLVIALAGVRAFKQAQTTVNPMTPGKASELVCHGVYQHTRNPMYVGLLFALIGWAMALNNLYALALSVGFVFYMNKFQIEPEEQALTQLFGDQFTQYKAKVKRWL